MATAPPPALPPGTEPPPFDAAYESACDAAAMELMQRATQRGEKFTAVIGRHDFTVAVGLMASSLGLSLDQPTGADE